MMRWKKAGQRADWREENVAVFLYWVHYQLWANVMLGLVGVVFLFLYGEKIGKVKDPQKNCRMRPTLDGSRVQIPRTNLDSFGANWMLKLDPALDPSLHLGSSSHVLSFVAFFFLLVWTNWFSLQNGAM